MGLEDYFAQFGPVDAVGAGPTVCPALSENEKALGTRLLTSMRRHHAETAFHMVRVGAVSATLAAMSGLSCTACETILWATALHDMGKLYIPLEILDKPGGLTREERAILDQHPAFGASILQSMGMDFWDFARIIALCHHEFLDGSGYPSRLRGPAIPFAVRLCTVVDIYDALRSPRSYKDAVEVPGALAWLIDHGRGRFDPRVTSLLQGHIVTVERARMEVDRIFPLVEVSYAGTRAGMVTITEKLNARSKQG